MAIPGLPALPADITFETVVAAIADVLFPAPVQDQWGLFLNGAAVVTADNVVSFEFKQSLFQQA